VKRKFQQSKHKVRATGDGSYSVRAVERVLDILDLLQESERHVSLADVAEETDLPKSSAFRYLATLEGRGYVEKDPDTGHYRVGPAFLPLQSRRLEQLAQRARPYLERLRETSGETVNLGFLDGGRVAYLDILESPRTMRFAARPGARDPIHSTALGKAIAAYLDEDRVRDILATEGMARQTERTIVDPDELLKELAEVRRRGYAVDDGENELDGRCVAVAVLPGRLPAAVSLSAPAARMPLGDVDNVASELHDVAESLEKELAGPDRDSPDPKSKTDG
jgi:IclR family transcriptional regulator, acetate operon repressor